jgi:type I restriction enzyme R subunit
MVFLETRSRHILFTDFHDELTGVKEIPSVYGATGVNLAQYRKKVEHFILASLEQPIIQKIRNAQPLSSTDLDTLEIFFYTSGDVGSKAVFSRAFPSYELVPFIRSLVGLDRKSVQKSFDKFLDSKTYTQDQIQFVKWIIDYLTVNGKFELQLLYDRPYTDLHELGLDGLFAPQVASEIVQTINNLNPAQ